MSCGSLFQAASLQYKKARSLNSVETAELWNREHAMDRSRWRKQIGMIDDHDECEWVNVSSGTGSPGLSRTNSTEP